MNCRHCQKPLSVGAFLFGCHFCGAFVPAGQVDAAGDGEAEDVVEGKCRLCLTRMSEKEFLEGGCSVCGTALGLFDESGQGNVVDGLGFPLPSSFELARMDAAMRADYERFAETRAVVLQARQAFVEAKGTVEHAARLAELLERWTELQAQLHEMYGRAELFLRLKVAAEPSAEPQEVADAIGVLLRAVGQFGAHGPA